MVSILIADDEIRQREMLKNILILDKYIVFTASNIREGMEIIRREKINIVISDYKMENETGEEFLEKAKFYYPDIEFIIVTAFGSIDTAVRCMKKGAFGFITKPVDVDELKVTIKKAIENMELHEENRKLKEIIRGGQEKITIIGTSELIKDVKEIIERVADLDVPVLIEGDTGTGKELVARAVHFNGKRASEPFIAVNMAGIPENLIESELFGYEKGSFTGAIKDKKGKFELAGKGTLFLDEIGEMNIELQAKLLRVLQEEEIERIGSEKTTKIFCRIVAATNRNLLEEIKRGRFREDLYYRLNLVKVKLPSLVERKEDMEKLVSFFAAKYSKKYGIKEDAAAKYSEYFYSKYKNYSFPGNIRELENMMERFLIFPDKEMPIPESQMNLGSRGNNYIGKSLEEIEREAILQILEHFEGNRRNTAEMVGLSERGLRNKLKEYGIEKR